MKEGVELSASLRRKRDHEKIVANIAEKYMATFGLMDLQEYKNTGLFEELVRSMCQELENEIPHGKNKKKINKPQVVIDAFKRLFKEALQELDVAQIKRIIKLVCGEDGSLIQASKLRRLLKRLSCVFRFFCGGKKQTV